MTSFIPHAAIQAQLRPWLGGDRSPSRSLRGEPFMRGYGQLAATGTSLTIGSIVLDQTWLIAAALGLVVFGALCIRVGFRRGKGPGEI
ncbi:hypothetical protein GT030_18415 [Streptomyces sp. SID1328]|uniref:hypothetical protein n=1 Tax=Streptomyces sp. SID1328 TaxID=2690250 RepID=UPI0013942798|nr:hypothetical protein [Streptomyces sp. SID1328]MYV40788.1 hypothetical protein [Streptomyces sp. SID1328]